jgi:hypothetical protein
MMTKDKTPNQRDIIQQEFIERFPQKNRALVAEMAKQGLFSFCAMRNYIIVTNIRTLQFELNYTFSMCLKDQAEKYNLGRRAVRKIYNECRRFKKL